MQKVCFIPARMGSSRFPNKPMAKLLGLPMIAHVAARVKQCQSLDAVFVATPDKIIFDFVTSLGFDAVMTSHEHERCTDRCTEALLKIEQERQMRIDFMILVQGDEPLIYPQMIDIALEPLLNDEQILVTNLMGDIHTIEDFEDPNEVKVVVDQNNNALYFSRAALPSRAKFTASVPMKKQICVIPFRRDFLLKYSKMQPTQLEIIESVDMLRILENGMQVKMVQSNYEVKSVDTPSDLKIAEAMLKQDKLCQSYLAKLI